MSDVARLTMLGLCAGGFWGGVAYLLGAPSFGPAIWPGVLASPLIGVVTARATHPAFATTSGLRRALWALASLYLGAVLFALPISLRELIVRGGSSPAPFEVAMEPLLAVLWGITLTGFLIGLWPMAYLTHKFIEWRLD